MGHASRSRRKWGITGAIRDRWSTSQLWVELSGNKARRGAAQSNAAVTKKRTPKSVGTVRACREGENYAPALDGMQAVVPWCWKWRAVGQRSDVRGQVVSSSHTTEEEERMMLALELIAPAACMFMSCRQFVLSRHDAELAATTSGSLNAASAYAAAAAVIIVAASLAACKVSHWGLGM